MDKTEVLSKLQKAAVDISDKRQTLITWGCQPMADNLAIWQMVNFEVQHIIRDVPHSGVLASINSLGQRISENMIYFRDNHIAGYSEKYAAALDGFNRTYEIIRPYLE